MATTICEVKKNKLETKPICKRKKERSEGCWGKKEGLYFAVPQMYFSEKEATSNCQLSGLK